MVEAKIIAAWGHRASALPHVRTNRVSPAPAPPFNKVAEVNGSGLVVFNTGIRRQATAKFTPSFTVPQLHWKCRPTEVRPARSEMPLGDVL